MTIRRVAAHAEFAGLTVLPIVGAAASTVLGLLAANDPAHAGVLRVWAVVAACLVVLLLVGKAVRDQRHQSSLTSVRYAALAELHNRLGAALDLTTEIALLDPREQRARQERLRSVAVQCCATLVTMTPATADVRAAVFELHSVAGIDEVAPVAWFGRREQPRTFLADTVEGDEVFTYLTSATPKAELHRDVTVDAPPVYNGDVERYGTFIRAPVFANNVVFGMLTVDAPKARRAVRWRRQAG